MTTDPFEILGISRDAGPDDIKRAFRRLAKRYHPDVTGGPDDRFRRILLAYQQLCGGDKGDTDDDGNEAFDYYMRVEIDRGRDKVQDLFDDFRDGILTLFDVDAPEYLDLFIELSPDEAARGGRLKLDLPLVRTCRSCYGFGMPFFTICKDCGGTGEEEYNKIMPIELHRNMNDGTRQRLRVGNLLLTVVFRIGKQGSDS